MTGLGSQFVRHAGRSNKENEPIISWRWCPKCMDRTEHESVMTSPYWEKITCKVCGHSNSYKVK